VVFVTSSDDGRYFLISQAPALPEPWRYIPYLALIFLAVALLAWPLAIHIGRPLRKLAAVVDRFGRGDLTARIPFARQDEIGDLARSFNQMADRIETLLVAERRLLQDVSHELRSPLARLAFAVELSATAPDREAAVARVRKEIARLNQLVGALIEVTREEGDPATRQHAAFSLDDLICEVVEDCALEAEQAGREVVLTASVPCKVGGDRELIRRAVENVVRNGAYYSPAGTRVEVSVTASPEMARIQVRDHGPGVPEADLDRIFQPFYRVDESRTVSTGGLGLGLSIAHRALQLHSGQISARNAEPGLLVEIDLPCL
jgi:two-component system sensor histidine kinase CpxA